MLSVITAVVFERLWIYFQVYRHGGSSFYLRQLTLSKIVCGYVGASGDKVFIRGDHSDHSVFLLDRLSTSIFGW